MPQVPEVGTDYQIRNDLKSQGRRDAERRFPFPDAEIPARGFRLVEQIETPVQSILDELGIGFEFDLYTVVHDFGAARLIATVEFRFNGQCDGDWRGIAID